ncbi:TPA: aspartate ammonia-lyase, partial [Burkholderia vietnamiensis]|nr:aspartate ammonia-lyase [Burkholderia vietnamiensis]
PYIGYKRATAVAKEAHESGKSIREVVLEHRLMTDAQLDDALQPEALIRPRAY